MTTHTFTIDDLDPEDLAKIIAMHAAIADEQHLLNHLDLVDFRQAPVMAQWKQERFHGRKNQQRGHS